MVSDGARVEITAQENDNPRAGRKPMGMIILVVIAVFWLFGLLMV